MLAAVQSGFTETRVASGLTSPTAIDISRDGRVFVAQQNGVIRVIKNDVLLPTPFASLTTDSSEERGLLGIALDPDFDRNQFVYAFYAAPAPVSHNRVSRFTAAGDTVVAGSEKILLELDPIGTARWHMGGAIHFGPDGKLYVGVGDHQIKATSQSLDSPFGKILRINVDGSIPTDNPFYHSTTGVNRAIWAAGLRNPYTAAFQPGTGRYFINDVGGANWEEINEGAAGRNFGWPTTEGAFTQAQFPDFTQPFFAYSHAEGAAITGGAFYNPTYAQFPSPYVGDYFFADFGAGEVRALDLTTKTVTKLVTGASYPTNLDVADSGALYYVSRGMGTQGPVGSTGQVFKVSYPANAAPTITRPPVDVQTPVGGSATFTVQATGSAPLTYQWQRGGVNIPGATGASYRLAAAGAADQGAKFRVVISNKFGVTTSAAATLTIGPSVTYLSDLPFVGSTVNGWGPAERDRSNGETGARDGQPLKLNNVSYRKGLGVHAASSMTFNLAGKYQRFLSEIGVDDEVGTKGSVQFQVFGDGVKLYQSPALTGASATVKVDLNVTGVQQLKLVVNDAGNGNAYDHADWAGARLLSTTTASPTPPAPLKAASFAAPVSYATGVNAHGVVAADFNNDGKPDLAVADSGANAVSVLLGRGDGTFQAAANYAVASQPKSVAAADLNGDGWVDLVTANQGGGNVSVLLNRRNGTFAAAANYAGTAGAHEAALADLDGDGDKDLAVVGWGANVVRVMFNRGDGVFVGGTNYGVGAAPHSIVSGDWNRDGRTDLAVADRDSNNVAVLLNAGLGRFGTASYLPVGSKPHSIRAADLNGDGKLDLVTANDSAASVSVLLGNGNGTFMAAAAFATGPVPKGVALGDVNGDGRVDIVTANTAGNYPNGNNPGGNTVSVLLNLGGGKFGKPTTFTTGRTPFSVALADFDQDANVDMATANWHTNDVTVLLSLL